MDNREAMIAAFNKKYAPLHTWEGSKACCRDPWEYCWQAATAHNTDAVIDECVNDVTQILQLISIYYAEKLPTYDARAGLSVICSNYPESLRNKLRSLKTNKEG